MIEAYLAGTATFDDLHDWAIQCGMNSRAGDPMSPEESRRCSAMHTICLYDDDMLDDDEFRAELAKDAVGRTDVSCRVLNPKQEMILKSMTIAAQSGSGGPIREGE